jgi:hypothetical protein
LAEPNNSTPEAARRFGDKLSPLTLGAPDSAVITGALAAFKQEAGIERDYYHWIRNDRTGPDQRLLQCSKCHTGDRERHGYHYRWNQRCNREFDWYRGST